MSTHTLRPGLTTKRFAKDEKGCKIDLGRRVGTTGPTSVVDLTVGRGRKRSISSLIKVFGSYLSVDLENSRTVTLET